MRERAIAAHLEQGMKKTEVCTIFKIQRFTLEQWLRIYAEEGRSCAKKISEGHSHHVQDIEAFCQFLQETPLYDFLRRGYGAIAHQNRHRALI